MDYSRPYSSFGYTSTTTYNTSTSIAEQVRERELERERRERSGDYLDAPKFRDSRDDAKLYDNPRSAYPSGTKSPDPRGGRKLLPPSSSLSVINGGTSWERETTWSIKTTSDWVAASRRSAAELKRNGSLSPFAWVLVEGRDIPAGAVVGGEERGRLLYVARAFYEGSVYPGKAGRHLKLGAAIPFNGREIDVAVYEVLVSNLRPRVWELYEETRQLTVSTEFNRWNDFKTVILVDDSASMSGKLWEEAREALAGVVDIASNYDSAGVDVYFLNDTRYALEVKRSGAIRDLFEAVTPEGQTPTGRKLAELLDIYIPRLENRRTRHKPISIVVITDGVPTDNVEEVIITAGRRLERAEIGDRQLGIQFVQIGDDEGAAASLRMLDDHLSELYNIRDMVDTTPFNKENPRLTVETLVKIITGGIDKVMDATPNVRERRWRHDGSRGY